MNDLLDRGDFTLTELLDEDDLLQEIKSLNTRLIDLCVVVMSLCVVCRIASWPCADAVPPSGTPSTTAWRRSRRWRRW